MTQLLINTSTFMTKFWYLMAMMIVAGVYLFKQWRKTKVGAYQYDVIVLKLPIFGKIKAMVLMAEFSRLASWPGWCRSWNRSGLCKKWPTAK